MEEAPGSDLPRVDVPRASDERVVGADHGVEEILVDIVEADSLGAHPPLGNEGAGKKPESALLLRQVVGGALGARDQDPVAGANLLQQLPHQQRHARHVDETEDGVVVGTAQLVPLGGAQAQRRVLAGVEELAGVNRPAEAIEHLEVDVRVRFGLGRLDDRIDPDGASWRRHPGIAGDAVSHRGCRVVVDRAEVALAVDEHVAQGEVLRHPHQGVVDRRVAVRVVLAHHLADDEGALAVGAGRLQADVVHRVEHPPVHRLEAVADVGQRPADDHAHRVIEVRRAHLLLELALLDPAAGEHVGVRHRGISPPSRGSR